MPEFKVIHWRTGIVGIFQLESKDDFGVYWLPNDLFRLHGLLPFWNDKKEIRFLDVPSWGRVCDHRSCKRFAVTSIKESPNHYTCQEHLNTPLT